MIVWLNGTFGAGKTTTAKALTPLLPNARIFDSEHVGYLLGHVLTTEPVADFQDWPPWRALVVATARQILDYVGGTLVIPQSVLVRDYWRDIREGLTEAGIPLHHVVLHATRDELVRRIHADTVEAGASQWRLDHLAPYEAALPWLKEEASLIDTTDVAPERVAEHIAASLTPGRP